MDAVTKVHIHEEQFDGASHPWCGRGSVAVSSGVFERTEPRLRCFYCDREWFPNGQPDWHFRESVARWGEDDEKTPPLVHSQNGDRAPGAAAGGT